MKIRTAIFASLMASVLLAGCQGSAFDDLGLKAERPLPQKVVAQMKAKGMTRTSPVMVRIFKEEGVLEVWKQKNNGRYDMISSYEICKWSGKLGPKFVEGDRQAPEGFYTVYPAQMNPNSQYYLAFNMGFPNAYDRAHGRTGQHLMVHGACSSAGCYSMTDEQVSEIYAFGRDAFLGGQRAFQIQAFPFRMTADNMARYRNDSNYEFWKMLKQGYDAFEVTKVPPKVDVCEKRYVFNNNAIPNGSPATAACPPTMQSEAISTAFTSYHKNYEAAFSAATTKSGKALSPSIAGLAEAKLVSAWSAARARGEKVSREPPSLNYSAPVTSPAAAPATVTTPKAAPVVVPASTPASTPGATSVPVPSNNPAAPVPAENSIMAQDATEPADATVTGAVPEKKSFWGIFKK
ncbi:murein L,D-transpeptidase YafK [Paenochrobactrum gallinarii]|uniref:Murein L,D-transpeptidase YafK n=1 Tax=Paenochrobactrum gallinarii TaxID=643673 RepID=A0A841LW84_9HYPH|nr:murein L,D-transpeptidase YafK [Paenochrobactrum gallinarii]